MIFTKHAYWFRFSTLCYYTLKCIKNTKVSFILKLINTVRIIQMTEPSSTSLFDSSLVSEPHQDYARSRASFIDQVWCGIYTQASLQLKTKSQLKMACDSHDWNGCELDWNICSYIIGFTGNVLKINSLWTYLNAKEYRCTIIITSSAYWRSSIIGRCFLELDLR